MTAGPVGSGPAVRSGQVLAMAIERAGTFPVDQALVRDEIFGGTFEGTTMGTIKNYR